MNYLFALSCLCLGGVASLFLLILVLGAIDKEEWFRYFAPAIPVLFFLGSVFLTIAMTIAAFKGL